MVSTGVECRASSCATFGDAPDWTTRETYSKGCAVWGSSSSYSRERRWSHSTTVLIGAVVGWQTSTSGFATDPAEQCAQVRRLASQSPKLLAEKVETAEDVQQAEALGFDYFQGYFFCRPEIVQGRALTGSRVTCLKLLQAVSRAELQLGEIERVIESDVSLTHRFVKYLGSAAFPWRAPITSVHQALVLLGEAQTRRWVTLISLGEMATGKPAELLVNSAVRAKCCDELAGEVGMADRKAALFLMGAFSLIDTMLDQPMADVLAQLPLDDDLKTALEGRPTALRRVLDFVEALERGEWDTCRTLGAELGLKDETITTIYRDAVAWAMESFGGAS